MIKTIFASIVLIGTAVAFAGEVHLVRGGKSRYVIVLADNARPNFGLIVRRYAQETNDDTKNFPSEHDGSRAYGYNVFPFEPVQPQAF